MASPSPPGATRLARFYRSNAISAAKLTQLTASANAALRAGGSATELSRIDAELCYYVEFDAGASLEALTDERAWGRGGGGGWAGGWGWGAVAAAAASCVGQVG